MLEQYNSERQPCKEPTALSWWLRPRTQPKLCVTQVRLFSTSVSPSVTMLCVWAKAASSMIQWVFDLRYCMIIQSVLMELVIALSALLPLPVGLRNLIRYPVGADPGKLLLRACGHKEHGLIRKQCLRVLRNTSIPEHSSRTPSGLDVACLHAVLQRMFDVFTTARIRGLGSGRRCRERLLEIVHMAILGPSLVQRSCSIHSLMFDSNSTPVCDSLTLASLLTLRFSLALRFCSRSSSFCSCTSHSLQHSFHASDCCCCCVCGVRWYNKI